MVKEENKKIPKHIPKENVYEGTHWMVFLSYFIAFIAIYLLLSEYFLG